VAPLASVPSYVPKAYDSWVSQAAAGTGLPAAVVAAQLNLESGFNPAAVSPTGAEGIAQFEPGTYASEGGQGSEFTAANELQPYIRLMSALLKWSGGDMQKALAAYNAGQGNWQAGTGYANTILAKAREPDTAKAGAGSGSSGGGGLLGGWPGDITGFFSDADHALGTASATAMAFFQPSTYVRIAVGGLAVILLIVGLYALGKAVAL
jgi:hypothetical protein